MPKDTKKKANPALEEDEKDLNEEETTDTDEVEDETETDTDEADADEEEVEEEPVKKPAKGSKIGKGAKSTKPAKADEEDEDTEDAEEKPLIEREVPKRRSQSSVEAEISKDIMTVKAALAKQPKVRIFIPLGIGEKKGKHAYESVTINGYRMELPKGEYVTVPQGVADIIEAHYNMSPEDTEMGQAFRLDRPRTKDGMSTDEALG